jgi:hypothetical protein
MSAQRLQFWAAGSKKKPKALLQRQLPMGEREGMKGESHRKHSALSQVAHPRGQLKQVSLAKKYPGAQKMQIGPTQSTHAEELVRLLQTVQFMQSQRSVTLLS